MKKQNQKSVKANKSEDTVVGLEYKIMFEVSIPVSEDTVDTDTLSICKHVITALEIVSKDVKGIRLEQSQGYKTDPVAIPILERNNNV